MIVVKPHVYVIFTPAVNYFCFFFNFDYNWRGPKPGPNNDQITATIKGSAGVWMVMYNQFCWK